MSLIEADAGDAAIAEPFGVREVWPIGDGVAADAVVEPDTNAIKQSIRRLPARRHC